ncbi:MAG: hypothetical protein EXS11_07495 [Gemmataceae bacterium]|nr:hypothetical protein [Gemmataceae bacterium]
MNLPTDTEILTTLEQLSSAVADDLESRHLEFKPWSRIGKGRPPPITSPLPLRRNGAGISARPPEHFESGSARTAGAGRITNGASGGIALFEKVVRSIRLPGRRRQRGKACLPAQTGILAMNLATPNLARLPSRKPLFSSDFSILAGFLTGGEKP